MKSSQPNARAQFSLERIYSPATIDDAWDLWTTKEGIESWWGPEGFRVEVESLDARVDGKLNYLMIAVDPDHVAYMTRAGLKVSTPCRATFTDVRPKTYLAFDTLTDFIPEIEPYQAATRVELEQINDSVKMTIRFDAMHNDEWTGRRKAGFESQCAKLDRLMAIKHGSVRQ